MKSAVVVFAIGLLCVACRSVSPLLPIEYSPLPAMKVPDGVLTTSIEIGYAEAIDISPDGSRILYVSCRKHPPCEDQALNVLGRDGKPIARIPIPKNIFRWDYPQFLDNNSIFAYERRQGFLTESGDLISIHLRTDGSGHDIRAYKELANIGMFAVGKINEHTVIAAVGNGGDSYWWGWLWEFMQTRRLVLFDLSADKFIYKADFTGYWLSWIRIGRDSLWFDMSVDAQIEDELVQKVGVVRTSIGSAPALPRNVIQRSIKGAISLDPKTSAHEIELYKDFVALLASRQQPVHIPTTAERRKISPVKEDSIHISDVNAAGMALIRAREGTYLYKDRKLIPILPDQKAVVAVALSDTGVVVVRRYQPGYEPYWKAPTIIDIVDTSAVH